MVLGRMGNSSDRPVAAIDVGTNTAQLVVARPRANGLFEPLLERAVITRLGKGVDATGRLSEEGMRRAMEAISGFVSEATALGVEPRDIAACATSASRDAANGDELQRRVREACGGEFELEIIGGDDEARLAFLAVQGDFGGEAAGPLVAIDVGGGSTEVVLGPARGAALFRHSAQVGSVRLTERCVPEEVLAAGAPLSERMLAEMREAARAAFSKGGVGRTTADALAVAVAATATSLFAVSEGLPSSTDTRVHGGFLTLRAVRETVTRLAAMTLQARQRVQGLDPARADVVCAGGVVLEAALEALGLERCRVSDRGLRWGILRDRFGQRVDVA